MPIVQLKKVNKALKALREFRESYADLNFAEKEEMRNIIQTVHSKELTK